MEDWCSPGNPGDSTMELEENSSNHSLYGYVKVVRSGGYPHAMDCELKVVAPPGYHLTVRIRRIEIYRDSGCGPEYEDDSDYLEIRGEDGSSKTFRPGNHYILMCYHQTACYRDLVQASGIIGISLINLTNV